MTITAVMLVLLSASIHAGWNLLGKKSSADLAFYCVSAATGFTLMIPLVIVWRSTFLLVPPSLWLFLIPTGLFQGIYFVGLSGAYRTGELAVAYPVARAIPVLIVPLVSTLLGTGAPPAASVWGGIVSVMAGLIVIAGVSGRRSHGNDEGKTHIVWLAFAVLAGIGTAGYSLVDDMALQAMRHDTPGTPQELTIQLPLIYSGFQALATVLFLTIFAVGRRGFPSYIHDVRHVPLRSAAAAGIAIVAAYGLVLLAYGFSDNVGYVVAFRQISLPIGILFAIRYLKEQVSPGRIVGIVMIVAGLVAVGVG